MQAIDIMMKNIELFQRALEKKQDNQFELVNYILINFQHREFFYFCYTIQKLRITQIDKKNACVL